MTDTMTIFDRALVRRHRDRAAAALADHGFLYDDVAARLADRLLDVRRDFATGLDLGCHDGAMARAMRAVGKMPPLFVQADLAPAMAQAARASTGLPTLAADEEYLPLAENSLDLITSCLSLHWVNDLPGALAQMRRALKPDGFLLAAMLGGETLFELRRCLQQAEISLTGGLSPRISPMTDVRDLGALLQRAGFALPVVDSDMIEVTYANAGRLLADLRGMGETNAVLARHKRPASRRLFAEALRLYHQDFAEPDGRVVARFQVLYLTGWAPDAAQQRPLRPGSAAHRLADALKTTEIGLGERP
jgi:NADH dehydrogenase [ubiquinone] 1 alpha subcomplex assembly factor 5